MCPWDLDGQVDSSALCRLEGTGFPVLTVLRRFYITKLLSAASDSHEMVMTAEDDERVINMWTSERSTTWRSLSDLLRENDQAELSQQIHQYLKGHSKYSRMSSSLDNIIGAEDLTSVPIYFVRCLFEESKGSLHSYNHVSLTGAEAITES